METFETISPYEFGLMQEGYMNRQMADWERTRFVSWMVHMSSPNTTKALTIEKILPLPIDDLRKEARKSIEKNAVPAQKINANVADKINDLFK